MAITVVVRDENVSGNVLRETRLELINHRTTARHIIRERTIFEVADYNKKQSLRACGQVAPTQVEVDLNGCDPKKNRQPADIEKQFEIACEAFERRRFVVLLDDRQIESLDEEILVQAETTVTFLRLVPLVGG